MISASTTRYVRRGMVSRLIVYHVPCGKTTCFIQTSWVTVRVNRYDSAAGSGDGEEGGYGGKCIIHSGDSAESNSISRREDGEGRERGGGGGKPSIK